MQILVDNERSKGEVSGSVLTELISRGGDVLYSALRRGVGDAQEGIEEIQKNVRKLVNRDGESIGEGIGDWIAYSTPDLERVVQGAVERVLKVLDLPRRSDIDALNENLDRVALALENLGAARKPGEKPEAAAAGRSATPPPPTRD